MIKSIELMSGPIHVWTQVSLISEPMSFTPYAMPHQCPAWEIANVPFLIIYPSPLTHGFRIQYDFKPNEMLLSSRIEDILISLFQQHLRK